VARGRVIALDLGSARIGVAISDPDRRLAVPHGTVRTGAPADRRSIAAIVRDNDVAEVVVGHPVALSGRVGEAAHHAERFAAILEESLGIPVHLQDERLSTAEADRALARAGRSSRSRRAVVDESAATIILQAFLDRRAHQDVPSP
jgi:putative Holliday junction resolvase